MIRTICAGVPLLLLAACSSTPGALEEKSEPAFSTYADNYQEVYRRVAGTAKRCLAESVSATAQMAVDTELYSELGYGEITVSLINLGARNYYISAKIEKLPRGSRMAVRAGNLLTNDKSVENFQRWAKGDPNCSG